MYLVLCRVVVSHLANSSFKSQLPPIFFKISVSVRRTVWGILKEMELSQWWCPLFGRPKWTLGRTQCLSASQDVKDIAVGHQLRKKPHLSQEVTTNHIYSACSQQTPPFLLQFLGPWVWSSGVLQFLIFRKTKSYRDKSHSFVSFCKNDWHFFQVICHHFLFRTKTQRLTRQRFQLIWVSAHSFSIVSQVNWNPHLIKCPRSEFPSCWSPLFLKFTILWP